MTDNCPKCNAITIKCNKCTKIMDCTEFLFMKESDYDAQGYCPDCWLEDMEKTLFGGACELYGGGYDSSMKLLPDNQGDRCEEREQILFDMAKSKNLRNRNENIYS